MNFLDPEYLINAFGLLGLVAIVFAESGLLVGFFLPGDSLLFTAGLLVATGVFRVPLWVLLLLVPVAAIIGDQVGYVIGRRAGPAVFRRPNSRFFRQEYVTRSKEFFDRYGGRTIVLARFVPIVRTIAPVMAGVGHMPYGSFLFYNILGGILWGVGVTVLGYFLGQVAFVREHIEFILVGIVALSVLPMAIELLRMRRRSRSEVS